MSLTQKHKAEREALEKLRDSIEPNCNIEELVKKLRAFDDFQFNPAGHLKLALSAYLKN
jgi:hypothetical protein